MIADCKGLQGGKFYLFENEVITHPGGLINVSRAVKLSACFSSAMKDWCVSLWGKYCNFYFKIVVLAI